MASSWLIHNGILSILSHLILIISLKACLISHFTDENTGILSSSDDFKAQDKAEIINWVYVKHFPWVNSATRTGSILDDGTTNCG